MTKLPSLKDYTGQTMDGLLALYGQVTTFSIVFAVERALNLKFGYDKSEELTPKERTLLAVQGIEREVMNGGFDQFFTNSSVEYAPVVVAALEEIDCPKTPNLAQQAIDTLQLPEVTVEAIEARMQTEDEAREDTLNALDQEFFKYEERLDEKLFAYIRANKDCIRV